MQSWYFWYVAGSEDFYNCYHIITCQCLFPTDENKKLTLLGKCLLRYSLQFYDIISLKELTFISYNSFMKNIYRNDLKALQTQITCSMFPITLSI